MAHEVHSTSRFAQKLYEALLPEAKRAVASVDEWAVLGTLAGPVRQENQDRMVAGQFTSSDTTSFRLIALSDGMGGLSNGQEAASLTLSSFLWCLTSKNGPLPERLRQAALHANRTVYREFGGKSGATLSAVLATYDGLKACVNVGDSRIYAFDEQTRRLEQLTTDDTLAGLARMGMSIDSRHNAGALLQFIGMGEELEPNVLGDAAALNNEYFILSTDGIHWVGNNILELIVRNASDHVQLARRLLQFAEMTGAHDNATVGVLSLAFVPTSTSPAPALRRGFDVELWTPQGKTILIMESRDNPNSVLSPPAADRSALPSDEAPLSELERPAKAKKTRRPKKRRKSADQGDLPIERPELSIEFDAPKREEDETSR